MKQYINLLNKVINEGSWIENERTGSRVKTIIDETMIYTPDRLPILTTKKTLYKGAIGEMLGYIRGYTSTQQFHTLGVKTWDANAQNPAWTESPQYKYVSKHIGDLGLIYGAVGNKVQKIGKSRIHNELQLQPEFVNVLQDIIKKLSEGNDDRGLIWNFWNPAYFDLGCLRPCMYEHQFSLVGNKVYLSSTQRSADLALGVPWNMIQCYFLLWLVCQLTGKEMGTIKHRLVNIHLYENQVELATEQASRDPIDCEPKLVYTGTNPISWDYVLNGLTPDDFDVIDYQHHSPIKYPFTV